MPWIHFCSKKPLSLQVKKGLEKEKWWSNLLISNFEVSEGPLSFGEEDNNLLKLFASS